MSNISTLRALVQNGWTRSTRQLFKQRLGDEQFDILKYAYNEFRECTPLIPRATNKDKDIYLSFGLSLDGVDCPFNFSEIPTMFKDKLKNSVQNFFESIFPKFKNEEINIENIGNSFQNLDLDKFDLEEVFLNEIGFNLKKESYKFSDLIKLKQVGNTATLKKDPSYTSEIVQDKKSFLNTIGKLFNTSKDEIINLEQICDDTVVNYAIKEKGKIIGYFSTETKDGVLNVGNYVLLPQYRGTKSSMNAILTVRDRIIESAKQSNIKIIETDVNADNPKLLGLYKRFGFQENGREIYSYTNEFGEVQTSDIYKLIGYLS